MDWPSVEDLGNLLDRPIPESKRARAAAILNTAAGAVEDATEQTLASASETALIDSDGTADVILPRWPVTAVTAVRTTRPPAAIPETAYTWSETGIITREHGCWPAGHRILEVTYTAGYEQLPTALAGVVLELAARVWANPVGAAGEQAGSYSIQWRAYGIELTAAQQRVIDRYRVNE